MLPPAERVVVTPSTRGLPRVEVWVYRPDGSVGHGSGEGADLVAIGCQAIEGRPVAPEAYTGPVTSVVNLRPAVS